LLELLGQSNNESDIAMLAHTLVLGPQALPDPGPILELAQRQKARNPDKTWSDHVLGLAYYRAGRFDKTAECLTGLLKASPNGESDVANWLLEAMAEQHLGHEKKAKDRLYKAEQWIEEATAKRGQRDNYSAEEPLHWRYSLMVQLLHREAEALIRRKITDQQPQQRTDKPDAKAQKP
jgi:tetratricopeptide (TPR) repeat protein